MKDPKILAEIPALLKSHQYYVAVQRRVNAQINRDVPTSLDELRTAVGVILKEAITNGVWQEAKKILNQDEIWLHPADFHEAQLLINEITIPDETMELDVLIDELTRDPAATGA